MVVQKQEVEMTCSFGVYDAVVSAEMVLDTVWWRQQLDLQALQDEADWTHKSLTQQYPV